MKLIKLLLKTVTIMFVMLFSLFFIYIYKDKSVSNKPIFIETMELEENKKSIFTETIESEENEEKIINNKEDDEELLLRTTHEYVPEYTSNKNFYYTNLNQYSKLIYDSLQSQKDKLKDGNSEINISNEFADAIEKEEDIEEIFSAAVNAFEYDNPDLFYLEMSKMVLYYEKNSLGNYKIYLKTNEANEKYLISDFKNENDVNNAQIKINLVVQEIIEKAEMLGDNYNKVLYVHDWLTENIEYDETISMTNKDTIYGAFVEGKAVCGGYAKAFKYLMDRLNINTIIVQGVGINEQGEENHAWNYVELNGKWYGIDCTWDDPIIRGDLGYYTKKKYYTYLLKGQNEFNNNHNPFKTFYETNFEINYPELNEKEYVI